MVTVILSNLNHANGHSGLGPIAFIRFQRRGRQICYGKTTRHKRKNLGDVGRGLYVYTIQINRLREDKTNEKHNTRGRG
ncbi:hypothetical protein IWQ55_004082 [Labrenzia sp. EL_208]|nr:hypothetical protein [Labrenzia sp. EL_132]MBG6230858.1 hypothetical protein [Labrenzia sp. EL_208]